MRFGWTRLAMDLWAPLTPDNDAGTAETKQTTSEVVVCGFPRHVLEHILDYVPIPDLATVAQGSRALREIVEDETLWKRRWDLLGWKRIQGMEDPLLDEPPLPLPRPTPPKPKPAPQSGGIVDLLGDLDWDPPPISTPPRPYYLRMQRVFTILTPILFSLYQESSPLTSLLFTKVTSIEAQCLLLSVLTRFVSPLVLGVSDTNTAYTKLRQAANYFSTQLRSAYTSEDARRLELMRSAGDAVPAAINVMKHYANVAWDLRIVDFLLGTTATSTLPHAAALQRMGGHVIADVHLETRPVFHERVPYNPKDCVREDRQGNATLDKRSLEAFAEHLQRMATEECALAAKIFPTAQPMCEVLFERMVDELLCEYIVELLQEARSCSTSLYLDAFASSFDVMLSITKISSLDPCVARIILSRLWEAHVSEYMRTEEHWLAQTLQRVCDKWLHDLEGMLRAHYEASDGLPAPHSAAEKRSFMSKFRDALLMPVVLQRGSDAPSAATENDEDDPHKGYTGLSDAPTAWNEEEDDGNVMQVTQASPQPSPRPTPRGSSDVCAPLQMSSLLNLETAIEMINWTRMSLQRLDLLRRSDTPLGERVRPTIVALVVHLFASLNDAHMQPGFVRAREQIGAYDPAAHEREAAEHVGPLLLFFELVHIGDTIQQMMQVFFDQLGPGMLGKTDFTNAAVREKRRFENDLDEHVAGGMSAGVELLLQHVEHIVLTRQGPRDYYPEEGKAFDVSQPTRACAECCAALRVYCDMLATCADKALLDVFYQEIGFRLYAVLCKHLKRQIVSLNGGFQVISDLNHYYAFISTLNQPALTTIFAALKMIGNLYIVDEPKELAKLVQDASLSRGTLRPEEMYEFLRSRCDFKTIEGKVDAEMYGIKIREDCTIS